MLAAFTLTLRQAFLHKSIAIRFLHNSTLYLVASWIASTFRFVDTSQSIEEFP